MSHVPRPKHDQRGGEGSGHHQNSETTQSWSALALPNTLWVQGWDTSCSGAGWKLGLGTTGLGQRWGFPPAATQWRYPPPRKLPSRPAHPGSVCWWCQPARAEDGHTPRAGQVKTLGLQMAWEPHWARRRRCQLCAGALESSCCQLGGGDSPRSLLWAGSVAHQSLALSSLSKYAPNKPREDVVPVAVGNEPRSQAKEQTPSGRALPIASKPRWLGATSRAETQARLTAPAAGSWRQGRRSQSPSGASSPKPESR